MEIVLYILQIYMLIIPIMFIYVIIKAYVRNLFNIKNNRSIKNVFRFVGYGILGSLFWPLLFIYLVPQWRKGEPINPTKTNMERKNND